MLPIAFFVFKFEINSLLDVLIFLLKISKVELAVTNESLIMAQSNSNESNVRENLPFWQNSTVDPSILWQEWSDHFHLALIANKEQKKFQMPYSFFRAKFSTCSTC